MDIYYIFGAIAAVMLLLWGYCKLQFYNYIYDVLLELQKRELGANPKFLIQQHLKNGNLRLWWGYKTAEEAAYSIQFLSIHGPRRVTDEHENEGIG